MIIESENRATQVNSMCPLEDGSPVTYDTNCGQRVHASDLLYVDDPVRDLKPFPSFARAYIDFHISTTVKVQDKKGAKNPQSPEPSLSCDSLCVKLIKEINDAQELVSKGAPTLGEREEARQKMWDSPQPILERPFCEVSQGQLEKLIDLNRFDVIIYGNDIIKKKQLTEEQFIYYWEKESVNKDGKTLKDRFIRTSAKTILRYRRPSMLGPVLDKPLIFSYLSLKTLETWAGVIALLVDLLDFDGQTVPSDQQRPAPPSPPPFGPPSFVGEPLFDASRVPELPFE